MGWNHHVEAEGLDSSKLDVFDDLDQDFESVDLPLEEVGVEADLGYFQGKPLDQLRKIVNANKIWAIPYSSRRQA